jgi:hypothetical protein
VYSGGKLSDLIARSLGIAAGAFVLASIVESMLFLCFKDKKVV